MSSNPLWYLRGKVYGLEFKYLSEWVKLTELGVHSNFTCGYWDFKKRFGKSLLVEVTKEDWKCLHPTIIRTEVLNS